MKVYPMSNIASKATINSLRHSFATHGLPHIIVTDDGASFTSNEFETFSTRNVIKHINTAHIIHLRMVQSREWYQCLNLQ